MITSKYDPIPFSQLSAHDYPLRESPHYCDNRARSPGADSYYDEPVRNADSVSYFDEGSRAKAKAKAKSKAFQKVLLHIELLQ